MTNTTAAPLRTRKLPFTVIARPGPLHDVTTGRVVDERHRDDLTATEQWQRKHEAKTGHTTRRPTSWSAGTGLVRCNGTGLVQCDHTFAYRHTRDHRQETS